MTPIKDFLLFNNMIFVRDFADLVELIAVCPDENQTAWLANTLKIHHNKPTRRLHAMPGMRIFDDQLIGSE